MTAKSFLRFLIGYLIAAALMGVALPYFGIPRAQLLPPAIVYGNAKGRITGILYKKRTSPTGNPFHVGDLVYLVDYTFKAKVPRILGTSGVGTVKQYTGYMQVSQEVYSAAVKDAPVPIKFEPTYPDISGIDLPGYGRSGAAGSTIWSFWWVWLFVALVLGYLIAPFLERIMLRESY